MNKIIPFFLITICLWSCTGITKPKKPKDLISKEKMVGIIVDMSLMTAAKGSNRVAIEGIGEYPDTFIYNKHNIDSVQFAQSNSYYSHDIKAYQEIYTKVKDSLEVLKAKYTILQDEAIEAKRIQDSIKRIKRKIVNDSLIPRNKKVTRPRRIIEKKKKFLNDSII